HAIPPVQPQTARPTAGTSPQRPFGSLQTLIYAGTSVRSPRGTGSTTSRELGFAILSSHLSSLWTWQAQGEEKLSHRLKSILAHGRAFVILTAIGGGLAVGVTAIASECFRQTTLEVGGRLEHVHRHACCFLTIAVASEPHRD